MSIFLVRHATAGQRSFASGAQQDDLARCLDEYGLAQARLLASLLGGRSIVEIHSSAALRCIQTVEPLSHAAGVPVSIAPALLEGSSLARALELVRSFDSRNVVLCSHGDIIPDVIRALEVGGTRIAGERRCAKGSVWELTVADGAMITHAAYMAVAAQPTG